MPEQELEVVEGKSLDTPDPMVTGEQIAAFVVMLVSNVFIMYGTTMPDDKQRALQGIVVGVWFVASLIHAAIVRKGRATGGGLVNFGPLPVIEGTADVGDARRP